MMKSLFISIQFIGILLLALSQKHDIKVTHDAPLSLKPGEEAVVSITLDKSDVLGFAKFQITLDQGLTAEVVEAAGASFTFNNQAAKFIWMSLPSARKINMSIRIKADPGAVGSLEMSQRFSYIYNNERKNHDAPPHAIMVGEGQAIAALEVKKSMAEKARNLNATVYSKRTVTAAGINQWRVDVEVEKEMLTGFAKIEERIPHGYTVIDLKSSGAIFSIDELDVKYIWYDFPESDKVTVSYKMLPVIAMEANKPEISGNFSFLKDEQTVVIPIGESHKSDRDVDAAVAETKEELAEELAEEVGEEPAAIEEKPKAAAAPVAEVAEVQKPKPEPAAAPKTQEATKPQPKPQTKTPSPEKPKTTTEKAYTDANIVDVPQPETGVFYRVQIAAGKNNLQNETFKKIYGFNEGYKLENHGSWIKYTTGHHQVYTQARHDRERIKESYSKFQGPFVTAYNDGERITVQEALMITSQKWIP